MALEVTGLSASCGDGLTVLKAESVAVQSLVIEWSYGRTHRGLCASVESLYGVSNLSPGSSDWLCLPRFDSASIFGALLGNEEHGRWLLAPRQPEAVVVNRHYVASTFDVETTWQISSGQARITDVMPVGEGYFISCASGRGP